MKFDDCLLLSIAVRFLVLRAFKPCASNAIDVGRTVGLALIVRGGLWQNAFTLEPKGLALDEVKQSAQAGIVAVLSNQSLLCLQLLLCQFWGTSEQRENESRGR